MKVVFQMLFNFFFISQNDLLEAIKLKFLDIIPRLAVCEIFIFAMLEFTLNYNSFAIHAMTHVLAKTISDEF